jgi:microcystin-dependent protein
MAFWNWSHTASANGNSDPGINFLENQSPGSLNDSARAVMSVLSMWKDDVSGATVTTGASQAYSLTTFSNFTSAGALTNQMVAFTPHVTNGATVTMTIDSVANIPLRSSPGVELPAGVLIAGTPYVCTYNASDSALYLQGFFGASPYLIPLGGMIDYFGNSTPGAAYAFPQGQQISQTTYASLYALFGSNKYGADGGGLFFLPDMTGRVSAMKEASATRLTATYFGGNSTVLGATGGAEKETLLTANLPPYTPSGSVALNAGGPGAIAVATGSGGNAVTNGTGTTLSVYTVGEGFALTATPSFSAQGGTSTPVVTVMPTLITNKILRVL